MIFRKKIKPLTVFQIADELHLSGLNAYNNYADMGCSKDKWDEFRLNIATELSKRLKIYHKGVR